MLYFLLVYCYLLKKKKKKKGKEEERGDSSMQETKMQFCPVGFPVIFARYFAPLDWHGTRPSDPSSSN